MDKRKIIVLEKISKNCLMQAKKYKKLGKYENKTMNLEILAERCQKIIKKERNKK